MHAFSFSFKQAEGTKSLLVSGLRNPHLLRRQLHALFRAMPPIADLLAGLVLEIEELANVADAFGKEPTRSPPSAAAVAFARDRVVEFLALPAKAAGPSHPASPLRGMLFQELASRTADPDVHVADWLIDGAPMGIGRPIPAGSHFPLVEERPAMTVAELEASTRIGGNHPSFYEKWGEEESPALRLVEQAVNAGYGRLFASRADAEEFFGAQAFPAPLGNVTKWREDGSRKDRLIQDLRANHVNAVVDLPERQILPRGVDHGIDLAQLEHQRRGHESLHVAILDFADAFMAIPLHADEGRFNCAEVPERIRRSREPLAPSEPEEGTMVAWRVLGFGGRPNPLVYSRVAGVGVRTAQALFPAEDEDVESRLARVRLQLYVDDTVACFLGSGQQVRLSLDVLVLWWLILGLPISWAKCQFMLASDPGGHTWIGVHYVLRPPARAILSLPESFVKRLYADLAEFARPSGKIPLSLAAKVAGRIGRVAHVVPAAGAFAASFWAALSAAQEADARGVGEAPPGHGAARRFNHAARWLRALLAPEQHGDVLFPLERVVTASVDADAGDRVEPRWAVLCDASVWGGGAALLDRANGQVLEYTVVVWGSEICDLLSVASGQPRYQAFWEGTMVLIALVIWASRFRVPGLNVLGDATGALQGALSLKGKRLMAHIYREIAWRQVRHRWRFAVGHVPGELNVVADGLSRMHAPAPSPLPAACAAAVRIQAPAPVDLWRALVWTEPVA